mgnify:CR=1 FL=1
MQSSREVPLSNFSNTQAPLIRFSHVKFLPLTRTYYALIVDRNELSRSIRRTDGGVPPYLSISDSSSLKFPTKSHGKSIILFHSNKLSSK